MWRNIWTDYQPTSRTHWVTRTTASLQSLTLWALSNLRAVYIPLTRTRFIFNPWDRDGQSIGHKFVLKRIDNERFWDGNKHWTRASGRRLGLYLSSQLQTVRETVDTRMAYAEDINLPPAYHKDPGGGTASSEPVPWYFIGQKHKVRSVR